MSELVGMAGDCPERVVPSRASCGQNINVEFVLAQLQPVHSCLLPQWALHFILGPQLRETILLSHANPTAQTPAEILPVVRLFIFLAVCVDF